MKPTLDTISNTFAQAPHASISSNEPYAVGTDPLQAELRHELSTNYHKNPTRPTPLTLQFLQIMNKANRIQ